MEHDYDLKRDSLLASPNPQGTSVKSVSAAQPSRRAINNILTYAHCYEQISLSSLGRSCKIKLYLN